MSETDHSPTPWKLSQGFGFSIEDAKGVPIAIVQEPVDAAHIVHCVNDIAELGTIFDELKKELERKKERDK